MNRGVKLWNRAKEIIPGGNQLLSKRSEMFLPGQWPSYYEKAKGVMVWDLDGRRYTDMSLMGVGSCVLGYANPVIDRAVGKAIHKGTMSTLNCPEEVTLAEELISLHPWAGMVRYARTGGEACAIAVRIARAASRKEKVAFCGYHGWADWYLAANLGNSKNLDEQLLPGLKPSGVPRVLRGTSFPFQYGKMEELETIIHKNRGEIGVIIMEVQRDQEIDLSFLNEVRKTADKIGAVLIFDEITSGFRTRAGGMHVLYGLEPDIVLLGKAMGNGYPISAIVGKKQVMQAAQETFISSTYWTERIGFAAALAVIQEYQKQHVADHLTCIGDYLMSGLRGIIKAHQLHMDVHGLSAIPILGIHEADPLLVKSVFTQEMLKKGFLASNVIYVSLAHTKKIADRYLDAAQEVLGRIKKAIVKRCLKKMLKGPVCHAGFKRLTSKN